MTTNRTTSLAATVCMLLAAGCEPKPGTRCVVKGEIHDIVRPTDQDTVASDATSFYWIDGTGALVTRPHRGGPADVRALTSIAKTGQPSHEAVAVVRDGVAFWSTRGVEITGVVRELHTGALSLTPVYETMVLIDERMPTPHPEGLGSHVSVSSDVAEALNAGSFCRAHGVNRETRPIPTSAWRAGGHGPEDAVSRQM